MQEEEITTEEAVSKVNLNQLLDRCIHDYQLYERGHTNEILLTTHDGISLRFYIYWEFDEARIGVEEIL